MNPADLDRLRRLLGRLQCHIGETLRAARRRSTRDFGKIAAVTAADTIYHVDRLSEGAIVEWFAQNWPPGQPSSA